MYRLHYAPDNASLIVRLALLELDRPFTTVLVDRSSRQQDSAAYRRLNPAGLIPVLETAQGPIFETGAIVLWLAETHGAMAPATGDPQRGGFLKWLFFVSNTLHADLRMVFYPEQYVGPEPGAQRLLHAAVTARVRRHYGLLEDLARSAWCWFGAAQPSMLDLYVAVTLRWAQIYARVDRHWLRLQDYPALLALVRRLESRASVVQAATREGLGETPFSAPGPCHPPEGSALG